MNAVKDLNVGTIQHVCNGLNVSGVVLIDICSCIRVNPSSLTVCLKCGASFCTIITIKSRELSHATLIFHVPVGAPLFIRSKLNLAGLLRSST